MNNVGEGITIFGIMVAVGLTHNYWLLFFTILPIHTWLRIDDEVKHKYNDLNWNKQDLKIQKLQEEVRLLRIKKK